MPSQVPQPYIINIEVYRPDGQLADETDVARVKVVDVFESTETELGQSTFDTGAGSWNPVSVSDVSGFHPPRFQPNVRFDVEDTSDQVILSSKVFKGLTSGSTVRITLGVGATLITEGPWTVTGLVQLSGGSPVDEGLVRAYDVTAGSEVLLDHGTFTASGYSLSFVRSSFKENGDSHDVPNLVVLAYTTSGDPIAKDELLAAGGQEVTLDLTVGGVGARTTQRVFGVVRNELGLPVSQATVQVSHLVWTVGSLERIVLATVTTDSRGAYDVQYDAQLDTPTHECAPPAGQVNLSVSVLEDDEAIASSAPIFNASAEEQVDLVIDRPSDSEDSEYNRLHDRLRFCLGQDDVVRLESIRRMDEDADFLAFVVHASGEDEMEVRAYMHAWLVADDINTRLPTLGISQPVAREVMYALIRGELGETLDDFVSITPTELHRATVDAIAQGIIGSAIEGMIAEPPGTSLIDAWRFIVATLLTSTETPTWQQELLSLALNNPTLEQAVAVAHFDNPGTFEDMLTMLLSDSTLTAAQVDDLRFVFDMYEAVNRYFPIVAAVFPDRGARGWTSIEDLSTVPEQNVVDPPTAPNERGWFFYATQQLTFSNGTFPGDIPGRTVTERARVYAARLFEAFGAVNTQNRYVTGLDAAVSGGSDTELQAAVTFLDANPDFDIERGNLDTYLEENEITDLTEETQQRVRQVQRVFRLTDDVQASVNLIEAGLDSALRISRIDEDRFIADFEETLGGLTSARNIHRIASHYASEVLMTLIQYNASLNDVGGMTAVPAAVNLASFTSGAGTGSGRFPNWVTLFGDFNKCATEHCQSVLSPGAYLVDVLEFIDGAPRRVLFDRRPDLEDIELSCANTNVPVPHIDLVNELLESVVEPYDIAALNTAQVQDAVSGDSAAQDAIRATLSPQIRLSERARFLDAAAAVGGWVIEDDAWRIAIADNGAVRPIPQTSPNNDTLEVFPEHVNMDAYDTLEGVVFPFHLPLVLGKEETNVFLAQRRVGHHEILEAFDAADDVGELAAAGLAYLDLASAEASAILSSTQDPWVYWGFSTNLTTDIIRPDQPTVTVTGNWLTLLAMVPVFLHRTGLSYAQMLDLLDTAWIHGEGAPIGIFAEDDDLVECNFNDFTLTNLSLERLQRISVFVRLWRKLGWSMRDVDTYLMQIEADASAPGIPSDLIRLSLVKRFIDSHKLDPKVVCSWWSSMDLRRTERNPKSLFDEVFLVGLPTQPEVIELDEMARAPQTATIDLTSETHDVPSHIRGVLGLSAADFDALWDRVVGSATALTFDMVSALHRVATFTQAIGMSVVDYFDASGLIELDAVPLAALSAPSELQAAVETTHNAVRELERVQATKTSPAELLFWLRDDSSEGDDFVVTQEDLDGAASRLVEAVRSIEADLPEQADPDATILSEALGQIIPADRIVRMVQVIEGPQDGSASPTPDEDEAFVRRYLTDIWPSDAEADADPTLESLTNIVTAIRNGNGSVADVWEGVHRYLVEQARTNEAITSVAELFEVEDDVASLLLTTVLQDATTSEPALETWKRFVEGGWSDGSRTLEDVSPASRTTTLVIPSDGTFRFVASVQAGSVDPAQYTLTIPEIDPDNPLVVAEVVAREELGSSRQDIVFAPVELRGGTSLTVTLDSSTGSDPVSLLWRVDNDDAVIVPVSVTTTFDRQAYDQMHKAGRVVAGLGLSKEELRYLAVTNQSLDLNALPLTDAAPDIPWSSLATFVDELALNREVPIRRSSLFALWSEGVGDAPDGLQRIADLTGWELEDVQTLHTLVAPATLEDPGFWTRLRDVMAIVRRMGLRAQELNDLLVVSEPTTANAIALRNAFRSQFTSSTWKDVFKPPRDKVRQRQRDALVGYLTSRPTLHSGANRNFFDANDLFAYFLIDVEMEPDALVSRISLAHRTVQLFVQRALLGLEDERSLVELDRARDQWEWMRNYRVWEANRKVFLYPENWIEPELRDDKTPFFRQLEEELQEDEISVETATQALTGYVEKLADVSNLEVTGAYIETPVNDSGTSYILHVVGRTRSQPRTYYYRTFEARKAVDGIWSPWREVELEINAELAVPAVFGGKLMLVWPMFMGTQRATTREDEVNDDQAELFQTEVQLVWSEYIDEKDQWSKPRVSKTKAIDFNDANPFKRGRGESKPSEEPYHLMVLEESTDFLTVQLFRSNVYTSSGLDTETDPRRLGFFRLWTTGDDSFEVNAGPVEYAEFHRPRSTELRHNGSEVVIQGDTIPSLQFEHTAKMLVFPPQPYRVLGTNLSVFRPVVGERQDPFFYETLQTSFFAVGRTIRPATGLAGVLEPVAEFKTFNQPLMRVIQSKLRSEGPPGIYNRPTEALPKADNRYYRNYYPNYYGELYLGYRHNGLDRQAHGVTQRLFEEIYTPRPNAVVRPYPLPTNDFDNGTPFGLYNWELFFHVPMLIAGRLSSDMKFEEALKWYHYVFDPRQGLNAYERSRRFSRLVCPGAQYWTFLPFFTNREATQSLSERLGLQQVFTISEKKDFASIVDQWRDDPFNPHLIARARTVAYQKNVVMKYLDNLIAWADQLFRQDTAESIGEATQFYILAAEILGDRPEEIEPVTSTPRYTYRELRAIGLDPFSNALVEVENLLVSNLEHHKDVRLRPAGSAMRELENVAVQSLFFRVPRNAKLTSYWDTVQDRLFKIRNSLNIDGVKRQLALFAPPIDPGLLVRAAAAGLDLSGVLAQLNTPLPHYRFNTWVARAVDLANEVRSFGGALLTALEKKDAEELALLRQDHEIRVQQIVRKVREQQIREAEENIKALQSSRAIAEERFNEYSNREEVSQRERTQISLTKSATFFEVQQGVFNSVASLLAVVPQITAGFLAANAEFGGVHLSNLMQGFAGFMGAQASQNRGQATIAGTFAGYERRAEDWDLQRRLALKEMEQIDQQVVAAEVRKAIAEQELENQDVLIEQSQDVRTFYEEKFTNEDLYQWMVTELGKTHRQVYRLAYDMAKMAERTFQFELGVDDTFIGTDYVDSLRKGLLAGERLVHDVKRMEIAYLEQNKREFELQKPVSLASINPMALQELRETGECTFDVPEVVFDLDHPGHYFRRIRGVRLTIPCVTGPYTSVSAKLSLITSAIRTQGTAEVANYAYTGYDDPRFVHDLVGIQSIATSTAQDDPGLFEFNFRDERYLPFEGAGAVSRWRLSLPNVAPQFDYNTITDVVLQMSYTARDGGGSLTEGANADIATKLNNILDLVSSDPASGLHRVVSLKQEYPEAYRRLLSGDDVDTDVVLEPEIFPFVVRRREGTTLELVDGSVQARVVLRPEQPIPPAAMLGLNGGDLVQLSGAENRLDADLSGATISRTDAQTWVLRQQGLTEELVEDVLFDINYRINPSA